MASDVYAVGRVQVESRQQHQSRGHHRRAEDGEKGRGTACSARRRNLLHEPGRSRFDVMRSPALIGVRAKPTMPGSSLHDMQEEGEVRSPTKERTEADDDETRSPRTRL